MSINVEKYLPRHHLDNFYIDEMLELSEEEIKPILFELVSWLKDMSKPIANQLLPILIKNPNNLEPVIIKILDDEKSDSNWKYNIIRYVLANFPKENKKAYQKSLKRIVDKPFKYELKYDVVEIAQVLLNEI